MDPGLPVTLVVKAANQQFGDMPVDCLMDWTIKQLKAHISQFYPSKPQEHQQKLIYLGKLLKDEQVLKDVLYMKSGEHHTVHLVCTAPPVKPSTEQPRPTPDTEGLRRRTVTPQEPATQAATSSGAEQQGTQQWPPQMATQWQNMAGANPNMAQMMYYQQLYMQQWNHYMQMYQQQQQMSPVAPVAPPHVPQVAPVAPGVAPAAPGVAPAAPGVVPAPAVAEGAPARAQQQQQGAGVQLAAGGAAIAADDDDDGAPRDWLDYFYTVVKFLLLMNIIYFYSSASRFMMVAVGCVVVYAVQAYMKRVQRRAIRQRARQLRREEEERQRQQAEAAADDNDRPEGQENIEENVPAPPPAPAGVLSNLSLVFATAWTFITTFFTSLFPTPPIPAQNN